MKYNAYYTICVKNSYKGKKFFKENLETLITTKSDKDMHGYGNKERKKRTSFCNFAMNPPVYLLEHISRTTKVILAKNVFVISEMTSITFEISSPKP